MDFRNIQRHKTIKNKSLNDIIVQVIFDRLTKLPTKEISTLPPVLTQPQLVNNALYGVDI